MIKFKTITIKNFLSVGNNTQAIELNNNSLTLVLGENYDLGGDSNGSRNGVGKCLDINTKVKIRNTLTGEIYETTLGELYAQAKFKK